MEEIKKIISTFIGKSINEINENTIVDKTVVKGSILIHRMYSTLAAKGYKIINYSSIKNFGDILKELNVSGPNTKVYEKLAPVLDSLKLDSSLIKGIGIDIENISSMPIVEDFRVDEFYIQ